MKAPPKQEEPKRAEPVADTAVQTAPAKPAPAPKAPKAPKAPRPEPAVMSRAGTTSRSHPTGAPAPTDEEGGLLKRMSAAIQKVMRGPEGE